MKKIEIAVRLYEIGKEIQGLEDEKEELRVRLASKLEPGEFVSFLTPEGPYRAKMTECSEKVLLPNEELHARIGHTLFLEAAKISLLRLEAAIRGAGGDKAMNDMLFQSCIKGVLTKTVLKILKGTE